MGTAARLNSETRRYSTATLFRNQAESSSTARLSAGTVECRENIADMDQLIAYISASVR